jgi:hypothetical protein
VSEKARSGKFLHHVESKWFFRHHIGKDSLFPTWCRKNHLDSTWCKNFPLRAFFDTRTENISNRVVFPLERSGDHGRKLYNCGYISKFAVFSTYFVIKWTGRLVLVTVLKKNTNPIWVILTFYPYFTDCLANSRNNCLTFSLNLTIRV